jgi:hypothetical protein
LIIHGFKPPVTKHEIIAATVRELKINGESFEKILQIRENNTSNTLDEVSANALFADYMQQIENVIKSVDNIQGN